MAYPINSKDQFKILNDNGGFMRDSESKNFKFSFIFKVEHSQLDLIKFQASFEPRIFKRDETIFKAALKLIKS